MGAKCACMQRKQACEIRHSPLHISTTPLVVCPTNGIIAEDHSVSHTVCARTLNNCTPLNREMKAPPSPDPVGESLTLTPSMLTYFCSNVSMCPGGDNEAKNTNLPRDGCVLKLAKSFIRGADNESTLFILAAARACHGTPVRYLAATKRAAKTLLSDTNRVSRYALSSHYNKSGQPSTVCHQYRLDLSTTQVCYRRNRFFCKTCS